MIFKETRLQGAYVIEPELSHDGRGFFTRTWCAREFKEHGLDVRLLQCNISFNSKQGTWRGMHYQAAPYAQAKLVRCTRGAICDVIVDLRPSSSTFREHVAVQLTADNRSMLYVPIDFGHGFITLEDHTEVFYQMSEFYNGESARGFRWNDPAFSIKLPIDIAVCAERDRTYPDFKLP